MQEVTRKFFTTKFTFLLFQQLEGKLNLKDLLESLGVVKFKSTLAEL